MGRIRKFFMFQCASARALFGRRRATDDIEVIPVEGCHPSQLCRCFVGPANATRGVLADHDPGCLWVAAMCTRCSGTGWCIGCGGDGTRPDWDPDKTAPQRPSALRIA
jgi:hypothetical protein